MDVTAQLSRVLLLLEQFCLKFNEQKENTTSRYADESNKNKIKDGFGPDVPPNLSSNERTRWKSIAKIFNSTLGFSLLSLFTSQDKRSNATSNVVDVRLIEISKKSLKDLKQDSAESNSSWFSTLFKGIGAVAGIAALGTAIYFIIKSIGGMPSVDIKTVLLVAGGILAFLSVLAGLIIVPWSSILKGLIALGAIAAILNLAIAPAMIKLGQVKWGEAIGGIVAAGLAITTIALLAETIGAAIGTGVGAVAAIAGLTTIAVIAALIQYSITPAMMAISKVPWKAALGSVIAAGLAITGVALLAEAIGAVMMTGVGAVAAIAGLLAITAIAAVIQYSIAPAMMAISKVPWESALKGVAVAGLAITGLAKLATVIGSIVVTGIGAVAIGAGLIALTGLARIMGYTADNLIKYNKVNPVNLIKCADAIVKLNKALASGIIGSGTNFISTFLNFFSNDPIKHYARFANEINAVNLQAVADSIASLNESLSSSLNTSPSVVSGFFKKDMVGYYARFANEINAVNLQAVADSIASLNNSLSMPINLTPIKDYIDNYTKLLSVMSNPDIFNNSNLNTVVDRIKQFITAITDSLKDFNIDIVTNSINSLNLSVKDLFKDFNVDIVTNSINSLNDTFKSLLKDFNLNTVVDSIKLFNVSITDLFNESISLILNVVSSFDKLNEIDLSPINNKVNDLITNLRDTLNDPIGIKLNIDSQLNTMLTNLYEQEAIILTRQLDQLINNGLKLDIIANNISNSKTPTQLVSNSDNSSVISSNFSNTKSEFLKNIALDTSNLAYS